MGLAIWLRTVHGWSLADAPARGRVRGGARRGDHRRGAPRGGDHEETPSSRPVGAVGMAVGVLFLFLTPGYKADLMTYLFGLTSSWWTPRRCACCWCWTG
jgi:hypothetical protein